MDLESVILRTRGLGNSTYVLASDGEALVVDPPRDAWRVREILERKAWRLRTVVETHVHNDYLSGALELVASERATIVAPARGRYAFEHRGVDDGDVVELGSIRLRALATPGHTPEHLAWEVFDEVADRESPAAVLTGGSLLVGSVGRTDLLGEETTEGLTRRQFDSLRALARLPDDVAVWPTHGSGSFCAAGPMHGGPTSTIGDERRTNPLFSIGDADAFRERLVAGFAPYPTYYAEMASLNRAGPAVLGDRPALPMLGVDGFTDAIARGARVVDGRRRRAVAEGHIAGSLTIELGDTFASYVGWILPVGTPLVLVLPEPTAASTAEAVDQLIRIGFDRLHGVLDGGVEAWAASGRSLVGMSTVSAGVLADELRSPTPPLILDVRDPQEWQDEGRVEDAIELPLARIIAGDDALPDGVPVTVACRTGSRALIAAGLVEARGHPVRLVERGGIPDVVARLASQETPKA
jgi:glyoxylase-like metal-dependent hydrolase (beta-lactamase superfamily II)/rhodanese-related sulfurtransferase